jgi:hypothetical protein
MVSSLRRDFLNEIKAERTGRCGGQLSQMFVRPRTVVAVAELQDVFRCRRGVEAKFPASPLRDDAYGCGWGEPVTACIPAEIDCDGDVPATVNMNMTMAFEIKDFDGQSQVNGRVFVLAVLNLQRLMEGFLALADKNQQVVLTRLDNLKTHEHVTKDVARRRNDHPGLFTLGMDK